MNFITPFEAKVAREVKEQEQRQKDLNDFISKFNKQTSTHHKNKFIFDLNFGRTEKEVNNLLESAIPIIERNGWYVKDLGWKKIYNPCCEKEWVREILVSPEPIEEEPTFWQKVKGFFK